METHAGGIARELTMRAASIEKIDEIEAVAHGEAATCLTEGTQQIPACWRSVCNGIDDLSPNAPVSMNSNLPEQAAAQTASAGPDIRQLPRSPMNAPRFFNAIEIDRSRGVLRKSSSRRRELIDEIGWYLKLPPALAPIAPAIVDYSLDDENPFLEIELCDVPPLSHLYLTGPNHPALWRKIMTQIGSLIDAMARRQLSAPAGDLADSLRHIYYDKTVSRLEETRHVPYLSPFWHDQIEINGKRYPGIPCILDGLANAVEARGMLEAKALHIIHGDLCLGNMLYDIGRSELRVIDPRGRFGMFDIFGDPLYDLAKLSHSFLGQYDLIIDGRFHLERTRAGIAFNVRSDRGHSEIAALFLRWLRNRLGADEVPRVRFAEALLFLSMVPLHADDPKAQAAMLCRGIEGFAAHVVAGRYGIWR